MAGAAWHGLKKGAAGRCGGLGPRAVVLSGVLAACGDPEAVDLTTRHNAIVAGSASGADQNAVVVLEVDGLGSCSGVLVRPNLVLTARHCVAEADHHIRCAADGSALGGARVYRDAQPDAVHVLGGSVRGALRALGQGQRLLHDGASHLCGHDIAFVLLDRAVTDLPVAPIRLTPTAPGELLTAVGWGLDEAGTLPAQRAQRGAVEVLDVGPSPQSPPGVLVTAEGTCRGDSGGPLLDASGAVVAVASYGGHTDPQPGAGPCDGADMLNVFSRVGGFARLTREAFARAAAGGPPGGAP